MIQNLKVDGLNERFDYDFSFYEDVNIFIGHIGTGKTTLLKLIWFLTSGNLQRVISEIPFQYISIKVSEFSLSMEIHQGSPDKVKLVWQFAEAKKESESLLDLKRVSSETESVVLEQESGVHKLNEQIASVMKSSQFFPTFRRMERHLIPEILRTALLRLASELSVGEHKFIAAVSTYDIIELLTTKHAAISEPASEGRTDDEYKTLFDRWSLLKELVHDIFDSYGEIQLTESLVLPCAGNEGISSANLSSGEKQVLGFLSYNAFSEDKTTFIDEPELSLHPDWQRLIIPLLKAQGTEKQFFVATHSIHIADKYKDNLFELWQKT